jgi:hypothetical protein
MPWTQIDIITEWSMGVKFCSFCRSLRHTLSHPIGTMIQQNQAALPEIPSCEKECPKCHRVTSLNQKA